jgi:hypothetical protein
MDDATGFTVEPYAAFRAGDDAEHVWPAPDMGIIQQNRRRAPPLPLATFGQFWGAWIANAAKAAAAPPDYVAAPLLVAASALIGNARWPQANPGWKEPPHLWFGAVGESGSSKTPGAQAVFRDVLPELERRMGEGYPERHRQWAAKNESHQAGLVTWKSDIAVARKSNHPPPMPPSDEPPAEPQAPRLVQQDVTIEKMAALESTAAPKGLIVYRDELAGFLTGMTSYNDAGRAFWLEAWNGGTYRVERQKSPEPICIDRHAVAVFGGIQPDRMAELLDAPDDGLMARFCWIWPEPVPFKLSAAVPGTAHAIAHLDRLRRLELLPADPAADRERPEPRCVRLTAEALQVMEAFGQAMQERQQDASGLMRPALGKARGLALRVALVLEYLDWCAMPGGTPEPGSISADAFARAAEFVDSYLLPMAERVYGGAASAPEERNAATLAKWIAKHKPAILNARDMLRLKLPGLRNADAVHAAAVRLIEAGWLAPMAKGEGNGRARADYPVNPALGHTP